MSNALVSHNPDISRLVDKGYAVAFDDLPYLIVRDIPYLDTERRLQIGAIVSKIVDAGQDRIIQENHEIFFAGSVSPGGWGYNFRARPAPVPAAGSWPQAASQTRTVLSSPHEARRRPSGLYATPLISPLCPLVVSW